MHGVLTAGGDRAEDMYTAPPIHGVHIIAGGVVALAVGSQLEVRGHDGCVLLSKDLGAEIYFTYKVMNPVRLRPDGARVACGVEASMLVLAVEGGEELFRVPKEVFSVEFSPDGKLMAVCISAGSFVVYDAESFASCRVHKDFVLRENRVLLYLHR